MKEDLSISLKVVLMKKVNWKEELTKIIEKSSYRKNYLIELIVNKFDRIN
jgi:hypothetical protein